MSQSANDQDIAGALRPPSPLPWVLLALVMVGAVGGAAWFIDQRGKAARRGGGGGTEGRRPPKRSAPQLVERVTALEAEKSALEDREGRADGRQRAAWRATSRRRWTSSRCLNGTANGLQEQMKDEIAKGDIKLSEAGGKLRVDLVDKVLFDSGEAEISKRGEGVLGRVGAVLAQIDDKQIQVSGHTDNQPVVGEKLLAQFPSNWELSSARAINVVRFLSEKAGVPPQRVVASGYGEHHPIASNKTPAGRARNRRIEILLTPLLDPKRIALAKLPKPAPSPPSRRAARVWWPRRRRAASVRRRSEAQSSGRDSAARIPSAARRIASTPRSSRKGLTRGKASIATVFKFGRSGLRKAGLLGRRHGERDTRWWCKTRSPYSTPCKPGRSRIPPSR